MMANTVNECKNLHSLHSMIEGVMKVILKVNLADEDNNCMISYTHSKTLAKTTLAIFPISEILKLAKKIDSSISNINKC